MYAYRVMLTKKLIIIRKQGVSGLSQSTKTYCLNMDKGSKIDANFVMCHING